MNGAICVEGLVKRFGATTALDGVDLVARPGAVLGLLGPNGSGKTTTVRVLATLLRPDAGRATVLGHDVVADAPAVRRRIGLTGQYAAVDEALTGTDNLVLVARLLDVPRRAAKARAAELINQFGLTEAAGRRVRTYSGGMRRRLDLAVSLIGRPDVLFLDEPTTGLDPRHRNEVWDHVRGLAADGVTVLLTTQYLEEADQLADDLVVIDRGRVIAGGTPASLKAELGGAGPARAAAAARRRAAGARADGRARGGAGGRRDRRARRARARPRPAAARRRPAGRRRHPRRRDRAPAPEPRRRLPRPHRAHR